jgi:hypothetical protein
MNPDSELERYGTVKDILKNSLYGDENDYIQSLVDLRDKLISVGIDVDAAKFVDYKAGWYQDASGNLYQYDGVVWDVVPEAASGKLEFLG